jgi:hypothetical protein
MLVSSSVTPIQLTWVKSKIKGRHELTASGPILGSLQRVGFWKNAGQAEFKDKTWSFQRSGFGRTAILQGAGVRPVAEFKANWLGGGMLVFNDGEAFQLAARGLWRPVWSWFDRQGRKLLEVVPHTRTVRVTEAAGAPAWNSAQSFHSRAASAGEGSEGSHAPAEVACEAATGPHSDGDFSRADVESKLPVLIMFSWHQILQTNDDAAAAAAISAAAG